MHAYQKERSKECDVSRCGLNQENCVYCLSVSKYCAGGMSTSLFVTTKCDIHVANLQHYTCVVWKVVRQLQDRCEMKLVLV